jgi:hypothetical protein
LGGVGAALMRPTLRVIRGDASAGSRHDDRQGARRRLRHGELPRCVGLVVRPHEHRHFPGRLPHWCHFVVNAWDLGLISDDLDNPGRAS